MPAKKVTKKVTAKKSAKKAVKKLIKKTPAKKKTVKKVASKKKVAKKTVKRSVNKAVSRKKIVKKATKKASGKKPTKKQKPAFIIASNETSFWINNGPVLNSLPTLQEAFAVITIEQFEFHAGGIQNDFAIWVEMILLDKKCAKELKKAKTRKAAAKKVGAALKKYKK